MVIIYFVFQKSFAEEEDAGPVFEKRTSGWLCLNNMLCYESTGIKVPLFPCSFIFSCDYVSFVKM